ncbi:MAG: hypothetical protein IPK13_09750 [Deltaproteobacteria bacterium]|nr:hypothetical protein [Deltaproteobacteria bacterium]
MNANLDPAVAKSVLLRSLKRVTVLSRDADFGVQLYGRVKSSHSASQKMLRNKLVAHEVLDIIGIRAITDHVHDCYRLIRRIHLEFPVLVGEFDDYIAAPKPNGYRALHTTVLSSCGLPVEIQVRTHPMHAHAESGGASHLHYKHLQAVEAIRG